jgi:DNA-binding transcriptional ArsR family regulator
MIQPELIPLVARRFKALGEPARLSLLAALQQGERTVSELVELTDRGQPNVSQHLASLVQAGLVAPRREGTHVYYRIADPYVLRICDAVCKSVAPKFKAARQSPGRAAAVRRRGAVPGTRGAKRG